MCQKSKGRNPLGRALFAITPRERRSAARRRRRGRRRSRRDLVTPCVAPGLACRPPLRDILPRGRRSHIGFWWWRRRVRRWGRRRRRGRHRLCLRGAGGQSDRSRNRQHNCYASSLCHNRLPNLSATVDNHDQLAPPARVCNRLHEQSQQMLGQFNRSEFRGVGQTDAVVVANHGRNSRRRRSGPTLF